MLVRGNERIVSSRLLDIIIHGGRRRIGIVRILIVLVRSLGLVVRVVVLVVIVSPRRLRHGDHGVNSSNDCTNEQYDAGTTAEATAAVEN